MQLVKFDLQLFHLEIALRELLAAYRCEENAVQYQSIANEKKPTTAFHRRWALRASDELRYAGNHREASLTAYLLIARAGAS